MTPPNTRTDIKTWEELDGFCSDIGLPEADLEVLLRDLVNLRATVSDVLSRCRCLEMPPEEPLRLVNLYEESIPHRNGIKGTIVQFVCNILKAEIGKRRSENDVKVLRELVERLKELNIPVAESGLVAQMVLRLAQEKRRKGSTSVSSDDIRKIFKEKLPGNAQLILTSQVMYESRRSIELILSGKIID